MKRTRLFYLLLMFVAVFAVACSDDDDITLKLALEKSEVALMPSETATVKVKTGNGGYVAKSADEAIAKAMFNATMDAIKITAVKSGQTTVNVIDHKGQKAMVKVVVKAVLALEKSAVDVVVGGEAVVAIKSGSGKYAITSSKDAVAKASIDGTNVKITGVAKGNAVVTVKDTDTNVEKKINVVVKSALVVGTDNVEIVEGGEKVVEITNGTGNYTVASADENVAVAVLNGNKITITAVVAGTTKVTVTDTETNSTADINVLVKPALGFDVAEVTLFEDEEKTITIDKGTGNYAAVSSNEEVATVTVDGKNIKIKAVAKGEAVVTVTDIETDKKKEIKVTVKARLYLEKTELTVNIGETERVDIFNVENDTYEVVVEPADVLNVEKGGGMVAPDGLKITPLKYNKDAVKVTVKSGKQEAVLMVTINPVNAIKIAKQEVVLNLGAKEEVRIIKGNGGYNVEVDNSDIVAVEIKLKQEPNQTPEYVVALEAKALGTANVKVTDVAGKEVTIKVTVEDGLKLGQNELTIKMGDTEHVAVVNVTDDSYEFTAEPADVLDIKKGGINYEGEYVDALVISPLKYHKDPVKVTVTSGGQKAVLMVTVTPVDGINIKETEAELMVGDTEEIRIVSGNGDYKVTVDKAEIVKAEVKLNGEDYVLALGAKAIGVANVTITDAANKTVTVKVTVIEKSLFDIDDNGVVTKREGAVIEGDIVVPEEGKIIADNSYENTPFKGNEEITSVDFNNVEELGQMSLMGCKGLVKVELRKVTKIGMGAFANCSALKEVYSYVEDPSTIELGGMLFNNTSEDKILYVPAASLDAYKASDFKNFFKLENIKPIGGEEPAPVPDADVAIDDKGLVYKKEGVELTGDLRVPDAGLEIASQAGIDEDGVRKKSPFADNRNITSIDFNNVTKIGKNGAYDCRGLTTVHLRKVTEIKTGAFYKCFALKSVYCYTDEAPYLNFQAKKDAFKYIPDDAVLYVPKGKKSAYEGTNIAKFFSKIEEME